MIETVSQPIVAFTGETGNSGLNMFDANQPYFWTGTMLTPVEWDGLPKAIHQACLDRAGVGELHGSQLELSGIEHIAGKMITLLQRYKAKFVLTMIEKRHIVGAKFVDTLLTTNNRYNKISLN